MGKVESINERKRLNRWSFEVRAKGREFAIPVIAFGPEERAKTIAGFVHADYSKVDAFHNMEFEVKPIRHESISDETYNQLNGLEIETKIMGIAMKNMANDFTDKPEEVLGQYITDARTEVAKLYGASSNIAKQQEEALEKIEETEESEPMTLGVDALHEVLNGK